MRGFPCSKRPCLCKHLSETLVPASGAARKGQEAGRCLQDGIGAEGGLGYHVSQGESSKANHLSRPNCLPCHLPWGSLPGLSSREGCHLALTWLTPGGRDGRGSQGGRAPSWGLGTRTPVLWTRKWAGGEASHLPTPHFWALNHTDSR